MVLSNFDKFLIQSVFAQTRRIQISFKQINFLRTILSNYFLHAIPSKTNKF